MIPQRGRPGAALVLSVERQLTAVDLARLASGLDLPKVGTPMIGRLRAIHHKMARLLATGNAVHEVADIVGYSAQRVGDLTRDPQFQDLMAKYEIEFTDTEIDDIEMQRARLRDIRDLATEEIQARLEDPKRRAEVPMSELRQVAGDAMSRTGLPTQTAISGQVVPTKITFNISGRGLRDVTPDPSTIEHKDSNHDSRTED